MKLLIDVHCHTMTLARPSIGRFVDAFQSGGLESIYSQVSAPGYLLAAIVKNGGETIRNLLAVVENDPAAQLALIEDDLAGAFLHAGEGGRAVIGATGPSLFGESWDAWLVCPLVMDFGAKAKAGSGYYCAPPRKSIDESVREMLVGVSGYRRARPDGRLVIRPFLGIDPGSRGAAGTEAALARYFAGFSRRFPVQLSAFKASARWKGDPAKPQRAPFAGVKLYPPLGFDPWPEDRAALDATRIMYRYCEKRGIPLVVHCDDQGYRTISLEQSLHMTDPDRWIPVLAAYPGLIVDFAHFGQRYLGKVASRDAWTAAIIGLMVRYPGVYADVAFNGCDASYWKALAKKIDGLDAASAEAVRRRLLFGTDFVINLAKARSYLDYVRDFADGPLDVGLKRSMMSDNPRRFLFDAQA